jgi:REP element-mobilizing transposase RayT
MSEHVHMMIAMPPKYGVSQAIGYIKGDWNPSDFTVAHAGAGDWNVASERKVRPGDIILMHAGLMSPISYSTPIR